MLKLSAMRQSFESDTMRINPTGPIDRETGNFAGVFSRYEETGNHSKAADLSLQGQFGLWGRQHKLLIGASNAHQWMYSLDQVLYPGMVGLDNFDTLNGIDPTILYPWYLWPV